MKFASFNKERLFDIDTQNLEYTNLETLAKENGSDNDHVYVINGVYIGTKSDFDPETPMVAIDGYYVNLPVHQLSEVKSMLDSRQAIQAINNGEAGFIIESYYKAKYKKTCYKAVWVDVEQEAVDTAE